ncbi:ABC transporter substrate-binding protein [uncultured Aeromicrobium sp.]|uniref:ABC transporter substrate-binding protein n=1 Tax=uncultured Aeromicrobium sp. TaxID=337820 RepID=UPI0025D95E3E|nr:ABC transporter substrate-binding protein [uncultured Aeromicrobium sp.]
MNILRMSARRRGSLTVSLAVAASLALAACGSSGADESASDDLTEVTVVLGWLPTAESGGFYAAQQLGYYEDAGLDVTIEPGGPQVSGTQLVASGRAEFGVTGSGANEIVQAHDEGIPLIAVNAILQDSLTGMMVHKDTGITSLEETEGMTWVNSPGVLGVEWVKKEYGIDFDSMQYNGSIANFVRDDNLVQQGILANEPYVAHQEGVDVTFMPFADTGFNPYNVVTYTTKDYLAENRDIVEKFVEASNQGWVDYMSDLDIATQINDHLTQEVDKELSPELTWFEWAAQRPSIVAGEGAQKIGAMTEERWQTLIDQMVSLGVLDNEDISVEDVADLTVTPDIAAPSELPDAPEGSYEELSD